MGCMSSFTRGKDDVICTVGNRGQVCPTPARRYQNGVAQELNWPFRAARLCSSRLLLQLFAAGQGVRRGSAVVLPPLSAARRINTICSPLTRFFFI